jgi:hypothetical protein
MCPEYIKNPDAQIVNAPPHWPEDPLVGAETLEHIFGASRSMVAPAEVTESATGCAASCPVSWRMRIEAIGPQTATALVATVGDPHVFKNG